MGEEAKKLLGPRVLISNVVCKGWISLFPPLVCELQVKHTPSSVHSLAKSHSGDSPMGLWKGIGHGPSSLRPLISSKKPDTRTQEAFHQTGETD
jgi:hypothetical protein